VDDRLDAIGVADFPPDEVVGAGRVAKPQAAAVAPHVEERMELSTTRLERRTALTALLRAVV
jgi:hypothetical protein